MLEVDWKKNINSSTTHLKLSSVNDEDVIEHIIPLLHCSPNITELSLENSSITSQGAKALAANTTLTTLDVGHNQIGAEGAKALAANTTLTTLNVGCNQIGAEGAKALAANTTLTTLNVGYNQIGAEGAKALAANTTLTTLYVGINEIGAEGEKALKERNPLLRANTGRRVGVQAEVPSLTRLTLFKVKSLPQLDTSKLPDELVDKLHSKKI